MEGTHIAAVSSKALLEELRAARLGMVEAKVRRDHWREQLVRAQGDVEKAAEAIERLERALLAAVVMETGG